MVHLVEWENGIAKFPTENEAREFQKTLPPGSSRWSERIARMTGERGREPPSRRGFSHAAYVHRSYH
jgi:hypothetical protein